MSQVQTSQTTGFNRAVAVIASLFTRRMLVRLAIVAVLLVNVASLSILGGAGQ